MRILIITFFVFVFLLSGQALACQFNTDCYPGSKCIKSPGSLYGICAGGLYPGNSNDNVPVRHWSPLKKKVGNTCSFDTDCDIGGRCLKSSGSIYGVCVK